MIRAALSILACRALEAHYRRNLARVVPQPDRETARLRAAMRADVLIATGLADLDFAKWQAERERDVRNTQ